MENNKMETTQTTPVEPTLTAADVEARIQDAVARAQGEWARAQAEQQRVAAMTQEERAGYELRQREAELDQRERALARRELKAKAAAILAQRGLPQILAEALNYDGEAECMSSLDKLDRAFRDAVQQQVDQRLRGETPAAGAQRRMDADSMSDAEYYRLNTQF